MVGRSSYAKFNATPPELAGDSLAFTIDLDQSRGIDGMEFVVSSAGTELWREPAIWEDVAGFELTKATLKRTYGARFASLSATPAAESVLLGDRLLARLDPH